MRAGLLIGLLFLAGCIGGEPPLFRAIDPARSGIDFVNHVEDTPELNIINYLYFYDGGGVAVGDVNGDDLPDIYFVSNMGPNRLYLNRGDLRFEDVTESAGVEGVSDWSTGAVMADVNGDGLLDIYVSTVDGVAGLRSRNELFINNGDGTFTEGAEEFGLAFRGYGTQAAFVDYDLDGDLDVFLLNHSTHGEPTYGSADDRYRDHPRAGDRLLRNDGGVFVDVSAEAGIHRGPIGYGLGVSISDLNLDGLPDIYVANDFHENDYFYVNNGDGTFTDQIREAVGHNSRSSMGSDAGDINNDGLPDVVVLDMLPFREEILKTSASAESYQIVSSLIASGYHHQFEQNTLLLNRGGGRFSEIAHLAGIEATDWSWAPLLCDLDNDGWKDLFVTNGIWRRPNDEDYLMAVSRPAAQDSLRDYPEAALHYIEKMPHVAIPNFAFRNNADLTFTDRAAEWGLGEPMFSNGAACVDLDNDGDLDLVINNLNRTASIFENTGGGRFLSIRLEGPEANAWGIGARVYLVHGDTLQLHENFPTRGFQSAVEPRLHFGLGGSEVIDSLVVVWPDGAIEVQRDVGANQHLVLRRADAFDHGFDTTRLLRGSIARPLFADVDVTIPFQHDENAFNDLTSEPLIPHRISAEGPALAVGDVNGDGLDDLFVGGAKWQSAALLLQTSTGKFIRTADTLWRADSLYEDVDATFLDADGDGDLDLYVVSAGNEWWGDAEPLLDRLYINQGDGTFTRGRLPAFHENGSVVRAADFDGDGDVDLFVGGRVVSKNYGTSPKSLLLRNDDGVFVDVTPDDLRHIGMVTDAVWADLDGDGALDLALAREWMRPIIFFGLGSQTLSENTRTVEFGQRGWWTAITAVDLTGDGLEDLVLGNLGLNSRLRASPEEPVRLYFGDFDADGEADHVLTSFRDGESYPLGSRDVLLEAFPSLARAFPTYRSLGAATIYDLFPRDRIEKAEVLVAEDFASAFAINLGEGAFELRPLPIQAQMAPVRAILSGDFDGDGHIDLMLGQNFYAVPPMRGRYDAGYGVVLLGSGDGSFRALEPWESGLWLDGDVRKLAYLRGPGGEPYVIAARNDDSPKVVHVLHLPSSRDASMWAASD